METPGLAELPRHIADRSRMVWVDLEDPTDEETGVLGGIFGFHVLAVEDCMQGDHLPKINLYDGYLFLIVHAVDFSRGGDGFSTLGAGIFIGENYLVTHHKKQIKGIFDTRGQVAKNPGSLLRSPDWLLHSILNAVIDNYKPILQRLGDRIEILEKGLLYSPKEGHLHDLLGLRREIFHLHRVGNPHGEILQRIGDLSWVAEENRVYFRDIYDRLLRISQAADLYGEMLSGTTEAYMAMAFRRMSRTVKTLAVVATIVMPLTLIAGIYGMNFKQLAWENGYFAVLGVMVVLMLGMLAAFKKKGWF